MGHRDIESPAALHGARHRLVPGQVVFGALRAPGASPGSTRRITPTTPNLIEPGVSMKRSFLSRAGSRAMIAIG